jgi:glucose-1-phosphate thymidylyltransferase
MTQIVEKPSTPISKRANIGLYYIRNWKLLFEGIDHVLASPTNKGEYYLTDAFQYMIEKGATIRVIDVEGWYDAGKIETMLETNQTMLTKGRERRPVNAGGCTIVDPVYVEDDVTIEGSTVGPNVSIGKGSVIRNSTVTHSIVGTGARIVDSRLSRSIIGDEAVLEGVVGEVTVGDNSEVRVSAGV